VYLRVEAYGLESGVHIPVHLLTTVPEEANEKNEGVS
jgi:hypothetical protein